MLPPNIVQALKLSDGAFIAVSDREEIIAPFYLVSLMAR
jgi:hypothetical protein